jgi:dihydroneopterin aldolase
VAEARAVIADVAHHSDHLIRLACRVLAAHGDTPAEREDAQRLMVVVDARRPVRRAQREDNGMAAG